MGAFDSDGNCIPESLLFRSSAQVGFPAAYAQAVSTRDHTAIYAGSLDPHYGHFLLESLATLWFAKDRPEIPIVWAYPRFLDKHREGAYAPWQAEILKILHVANPPIFVRAPTRFRELIIPEAGFVMPEELHPTQEAFLGAFQGSGRQAGLKLWLSRSGLGDKASNLLEAAIERRLSAAGWTVIHPEQLSPTQQLAYLSAAERVAGDEGSAFHSLVLLQDAKHLQVDIFRRQDSAKHQHDCYKTIADRKGFSQAFHLCKDEIFVRRKGAHVTKISRNASEYLDKLGVPPDMPVAANAEGQRQRPRGTHTARRINRFTRAANAQSYLEIGVAGGNTFLNVTINRKHAVDPHFRFDPRAYEAENSQFFEMPSNDFFLYWADHNTKYDIIFLDGLHTFEQTFRDFCASQSHCHDDTIWVIDDVYPNDIFSAHTDQSKALKYRRLHALDSKGWHGDVFKVVFAIHDFFPNYSYKTMSTGGNPQTVVMRRPRNAFKPFCNSLETISRLSYYDFCENTDILELATEDDVAHWVRRSLQRHSRRSGTANDMLVTPSAS